MYAKASCTLLKQFLILILSGLSFSLFGMQVQIVPYNHMRDAYDSERIALQGKAGGIVDAYHVLNSESSLVARIGKQGAAFRTVGFIHYVYAGGGQEKLYAYIAYLGVSAKIRGKGIGRLLLDSAIKDIRSHGCHCIKLDVLRNNCSAIRLYESMGFVSANMVDKAKPTVSMVYDEVMSPQEKLSWLYYFASQNV